VIVVVVVVTRVLAQDYFCAPKTNILKNQQATTDVNFDYKKLPLFSP